MLTQQEQIDLLNAWKEEQEKKRKVDYLKLFMQNPQVAGGYMLGGILSNALSGLFKRSEKDPRGNGANNEPQKMTYEEFQARQKAIQNDPQLRKTRADDLANYNAGGKPFDGILGNLDALEKLRTKEEIRRLEQGFAPNNYSLQNAIQYPNTREYWGKDIFF